MRTDLSPGPVMMVAMYHPWRALAALPDWSLSMAALSPRRAEVRFSSRTVTVDRSLTQAQRRCAIAHELIHIERGPVPSDPWLHRREERAVRREAARRLISLSDLVTALRWSRDLTEVAEELWVDVPTLRTRLAHLTESERAWLDWELT